MQSSFILITLQVRSRASWACRARGQDHHNRCLFHRRDGENVGDVPRRLDSLYHPYRPWSRGGFACHGHRLDHGSRIHLLLIVSKNDRMTTLRVRTPGFSNLLCAIS
jgi:hypothetical protein